MHVGLLEPLMCIIGYAYFGPMCGRRGEPTGSMLSAGWDEDSATNVLDRTDCQFMNYYTWFFFCKCLD